MQISGDTKTPIRRFEWARSLPSASTAATPPGTEIVEALGKIGLVGLAAAKVESVAVLLILKL
jgi:hypothetical protein